MLNFTLKPGDYFMIGDDIKVVMAGGTANNCRIMVEAPREYNIVRSRVLEKQAVTQNEKEKIHKYYPEPQIPKEDIQRYIAEQRAERQNNQSDSNLQIILGICSSL